MGTEGADLVVALPVLLVSPVDAAVLVHEGVKCVALLHQRDGEAVLAHHHHAISTELAYALVVHPARQRRLRTHCR